LSRKADANEATRIWLAHIAHSCPSRTRLSFPDLKGKPAELTELCDKAMKLKGVRQVEGRPLTGSLILTHDGSPEDLVRSARRAAVFDVKDAAPEEHQIHADARAWQSWIDRTLKEGVGGGFDARALGAAAFFAMALRQLAAGHVMPPAATALLYALNLLSPSNKADPGAPDGNGGA
jgi:hypothetical protein